MGPNPTVLTIFAAFVPRRFCQDDLGPNLSAGLVHFDFQKPCGRDFVAVPGLADYAAAAATAAASLAMLAALPQIGRLRPSDSDSLLHA